MTSELGRRIAFTLGALLVYRFGSYIPLPGIDPSVWARFFGANADGILGLFNISAGGGVRRLAVFALGITPYLTAAILLQLATVVSSRLRRLRTGGEPGRRVLVRYAYGLTLFLAAFQAYGVASGLEGVTGLVTDPGLSFRLGASVTLAGGAMVLVWLSDQITMRGIGNGISLLLFVGIVTELPSTVAETLDLGRQGVLPGGIVIGLPVLAVAGTGLVVFMELARRRLLVQFAARQVGMVDGAAHLSLKLNSAGIIPVMLASWLLLVPLIVAAYAGGDGPGWASAIARELGPGRPLFLVLYALAIVACTFIYTALVLDPSDAADRLKRYGGVIPGIAPGEATAEHLDNVLSRTTLLGAVYLALVCLTPDILVSYAHVPFYFGGTSLLVLVCTALDVSAHVRGDAAVNVGG